MRIAVKPLSVNEAWKGRRYKTATYKRYERAVFFMLPKITVPKSKLRINLTFGFSNSGADIDNPVKPILDILQKRYKFNDNQIYELNLKKEIVKKGSEFIEIKIMDYDNVTTN